MACIEDAKALKILLEYSLQFWPYDDLQIYLKDSYKSISLYDLNVENLPELGGSNSGWEYTIRITKESLNTFSTEREHIHEEQPLVINYGLKYLYINIE